MINGIGRPSTVQTGFVFMKDVDYSKGAPPEYRCCKCGAHGVKLWRLYQTIASHCELMCAECSVEDQKKRDATTVPRSAENIGDDGRWQGHYGRGDQIGWRVPAVPDEEGVSFWGYTVPEAGVQWWRRLPTRLPQQTEVAKLG